MKWDGGGERKEIWREEIGDRLMLVGRKTRSGDFKLKRKWNQVEYGWNMASRKWGGRKMIGKAFEQTQELEDRGMGQATPN